MRAAIGEFEEWRSKFKESAWGYLLLFTNMYCCNFDVGDWIHYVYKVSFTYLLPFVSYTDTCDSIIMFFLGLFVVVYSKQCCLQRNKYDQSLRVIDIYSLTKFHYFMLFRFRVMGVEKRKWTKLSIIAPYIYDARYHVNPYILSTTGIFLEQVTLSLTSYT